MMPVIDGVMLAVSSSLAASIVVKVTVIATLGLIAAWLARGNRAAVRHALLAAMFGAMLLLPIVSVVMPPLHVGVPVRVQSQTALLQLGTGVDAKPSITTAGIGSHVTPATPQASKLSLSNLLLTGWAVGAALFLLPVVIGLWQIRLLRRTGLPWRRGQSVVETLALDAGINRRVEVLLQEAVPGPMTCGVVHPAIFLPRDAENWNRGDLKRAIVHELEHVRRWDTVSCYLARVAGAMYWFHPMVWIAWRRLVLEAERSCDDAVLRHSEATAYADQLVDLAKRLLANHGSPLLAMANRGDLATRVSAVLDNRQRRGQAGLLSLALVCIVAVAFVFVLSPLTMIRAAQESQLAFEVASVRPNSSAGFRNAQFQFLPGGRLVIRNEPLAIIVAAAYNLPFQSPRLTGGLEWEHAASEKYDIEAVAPVGAVPQGLPANAREDKMRLMLQSLLEERFKLKMRREPKEQPVYAIVVAKNGPKLQNAKMQEKDCPEAETPGRSPAACHSITGGMGRGIHGDAVSIADVALFVQNWSDQPVVDKTSLTNLYNIQTDGWAPMRPRPPSPDGQPPQGGDAGLADPDRQTLADLFRQLGLRMESQRAVIDMFFVEHAERPTGN